MRVIAAVAGFGLVCASLAAMHTGAFQADASAAPQSLAAPGAVERSALAKIDFLVGDWEGEGWALTRSGERQRFWVKEFYRYRGGGDLLDMEGRFGDILSDGTRTGEQEYDLGVLYYDRASSECRMWHYSSTGEVCTVTMDTNVTTRELSYTKEYSEGRVGKFHLVVGADGEWISTFEILQSDQTWVQVMEFRMERVTR